MAARLSLMNHAPTPPSRDRRRFSVFCDEWLALQRGEVRESTYVKYCTILENHVKPKLGNCYPLAFCTHTVEEFKWALLDADGLSPKTVKDVMVVLRSVVDYTAQQFSGRFPLLEFHGKSTRDCGLEGVHFHTLRHTFATRCVEVGFELKSLSEVLGHANTSITLDRYVHSSLDLKRENMNKLTMLSSL